MSPVATWGVVDIRSCMSQWSVSTCSRLQHQETSKLIGRTGVCFAKENFYFLKKMGRSGDWKQKQILLWPKAFVSTMRSTYYPGQKKKKTSPRFAVGRTLFDLVIMLDNERSAQGKVIRYCMRNPQLLPCVDCAPPSMRMSDDMEQRSSHHKSREWFFFFFFVQSSICM